MKKIFFLTINLLPFSITFAIDNNRLSQLVDETLRAKNNQEIITVAQKPELNQLRMQLEKTQILFWNQNNIEDVKKTKPDLLFFVNSLKAKCNNSNKLFKLLLSLGLGYAYVYTLTDLTLLQKEIDKETSLLIEQIIAMALSSKNGKIDESQISNYAKTFGNKMNNLFPNKNADSKDPNFIFFSQLMVLKGSNLPGIIKKYNITSHKLQEVTGGLITYFIWPAIDILNSAY